MNWFSTFKGIYFFLFLGWLMVRVVYKKKFDNTKAEKEEKNFFDKFLMFANYTSMMFIPLFVVFTSKLDNFSIGIPSFIRGCSCVLYLLNIGLFLKCHYDLGSNWSQWIEIKKEHKLIDNGIYSKIRHPMYLHFWLYLILQGFILNNWIVFLFGIIFWSIFYFTRVPQEEEALLKQFGKQYSLYMKRTGRILPKLF